MLFKMAMRNIRRRPVQSLISVFAVALGLTLTVFMVNAQMGIWDGVVNASVKAASGHVVVQAEGFQASQDGELLIPESAAVADAVRAVAPGRTVLRRATLEGLLQSPTNNVGVSVVGVEAEAEAEVNAIAGKLVDGAWLGADDDTGVVLGHRLATRLDVDVGDKVVVMVGVDGEYESKPLRVRGLFDTGSREVDSFLCFVPLTAVQGMLPSVSDPASQVSLILDGRTAHQALLAPVRAAVAEHPVEVLGWDEALPDLKTSRELDLQFAVMMWPVVAFVVSIGVLNTLLMSLFERTRELGVMLAVGMRPGEVFRLMLTEGFLLGSTGALLGLLAGLALTYPAATLGFELPGMEESSPVGNVAFDGIFYAAWSPLLSLAWAALFVTLATLVSAYPAWKASRTDPVTSMRQS